MTESANTSTTDNAGEGQGPNRPPRLREPSMAEITCPETVSEPDGFHWHTCGRPIKRDGKCGIHAAAKERVAKNDRARQSAEVEAQKVVDRLDAYGIFAYVRHDGTARLGLSARGLADHLESTSPLPPTAAHETSGGAV